MITALSEPAEIGRYLQVLREQDRAAIGHQGDAANHQYDINDFFAAVKAGNFPAVSFLKAPGYQDGHAGYSDPLDEQSFVVQVINFLQQQRDWDSTAVIINYDDSDGWYDHQLGAIVNQSASASDALLGTDNCGDGTTSLAGPNGVWIDPSAHLWIADGPRGLREVSGQEGAAIGEGADLVYGRNAWML